MAFGLALGDAAGPRVVAEDEARAQRQRRQSEDRAQSAEPTVRQAASPPRTRWRMAFTMRPTSKPRSRGIWK